MSYTRWQTNWLNGSTNPTNTPVNMGALNHVEAGIVDVDTRLTTVENNYVSRVGFSQGAINVGSGAGTTGLLTGGADTQVLTRDSANVNGLGVKWATPAAGGGSSGYNLIKNPAGTSLTQRQIAQFTGSGVTVTDDGTSTTTINIPGGGTGGIPASTITARGDLIVGGVSATPVRLPVGADGYRIKALAAAPGGSGMFWVPPINESISDGTVTYSPRVMLRFLGTGVTVADNSGGTPPSTDVTIAGSTGTPALITTAGDLIVGNASGAASRLASTLSDGQVLTLNALVGQGLNWANLPSSYGQIQIQGSVVQKQNVLNFIGSAVNAVNNNGQVRTDVTIAELTSVAPDHGLIQWAFPPYVCGSTQAMTSGLVYLVKIKIPFIQNITKILWHLATSAVGATTAQNEVGIYNSAGTKQASVNIDAASSSANQTLITSTISSITINPPFVWVGFVFNAATTPVGLGRSNSAFVNVFNAGLTASTYDFATNISSQTVLPSSLTIANNIAGPGIWAAVAA